MTNNFTTLKSNPASQRFALVRLEPARYANDDLVSIGSGKYTLTFKPDGTNPGIISQVQANGVALTKVTTVTNSGEWSYSETTGLLTVKSTPSSTNIICLFYYLFYTGDYFKYTYETPDDNSSPNREWAPRLKSYPQISSSIENVITGKLSISGTSLTIINNGFEFQYYLTANDSFSRKNIWIWYFIDDVANVQKTFLGKIVDLSLPRTEVTINFEDGLSLLSQPALMGDNSSEAFLNLSDNANMDPAKDGTPSRFLIGKGSKYKSQVIIWATTSEHMAAPIPSSMIEAVCITYGANITTSSNRSWNLCRTRDGFLDFTCTPSSINPFTSSLVPFIYFQLNSTQIDYFNVGDNFIITKGGTDYYFQVWCVDRTLNRIYTDDVLGNSGHVSTGDAITGNKAPCIAIVQNGMTYYPVYGRDYTANMSSTSGGNKSLSITFGNNFEANNITRIDTVSAFVPMRGSMSALNPATDKVYFRIKPDRTNISHAKTVQYIFQKAGLTVNSASITAADTALTANCAFSIPLGSESSYGTYYSYIEAVLKSTLGYISINNSLDVLYNIFVTPSGSTTITNDEALLGTFKTAVKYKDIVTQIIATNSHYDWSEPSSFSSSTPYQAGSSSSQTSLKAQYLHGVSNIVKLEHVLDTITTALANIIRVRRERWNEYEYEVYGKHIDSILGDDVLLSKDGLLGNSASKSVKIFHLEKSPGKTKVVASDLLSL